MEFRVLGPLEIVSSGEALPLGGAKQRAVIALLLLQAPEPVAPDRLIDELWGERPPASAVHALQVYVSTFRTLIRRAGGADAVRISPPGYRLEVDLACVDAHRLARLLDEGQRALRSHPAAARVVLEEGVGLWRGPPLADLTQFEFARRERTRLEELHARTVEGLAEARIALGEHAGVISTLTRLVEADPLRESPRRLLMLSLYRSGRQAEALAVYRDACLALDQIGLRPGPELREMEALILHHDESLRAADRALGEEGGGVRVAGHPAVISPWPAPPEPSSEAGGEAPSAVELSQRRVRKVVTALCCEVTASLSSSAELDPEVLIELTSRYLEGVPAVIERYGGRVTSLLGAGAVAVYGIPRCGEDDALEAIRAAVAIRAHFAAVVDHSCVPLGLRVAVNTGLVLVDRSGSVVLGDAITAAGGLMQVATAGEILLDQQTCSLVEDEVEVEPLQRSASGAPGRRRAYRLLAVRSPAPMLPARALTPFVGRERELAFLRSAWVRCVEDGDCHLFTLLGPAGIGKSRLVAELVDSLGGGARLLSGRCLHYGDGITFWPIVEVLRSLGDATEQTLGRLSSGAAANPHEMFWEIQRALEDAARAHPLIVHIDDLQWAEPMLLELLNHIADYSRGLPLLLLCVARTEFLEEQAGWGGGKPNSTSITLEGLHTSSCEQLLERLGNVLPPEEQDRVVAASGGNPLFLQELATLAAERGTMVVPPTVNALLAARLDRLERDERALLECGAVEGEIFHVSAVCELVGPVETEGVAEQLAQLVRKQLIRAHPGSIDGGQAFRFRHLLIRDAAYDGITKASRATLHQRFAGWLESNARDLPEFDELAGWHLEQAIGYGSELGRLVDDGLRTAAAGHLHAAGVRAAQRGDTIAARKLLDRAWLLAPEGGLRARTAVELADVLMEGGDLQRIDSLLEAGEADPQASAHAGLVRLHWLTIVRLDEAIQTIDTVLPGTLARLQEAGDESGLAKAHLAGYWAASQAARIGASARHAGQAAEHARRAGDDGVRSKALALYLVSILHGSMEPLILQSELDRIEAQEPGPYLAQLIELGRAEVQRLCGDLDRARPRFLGVIERFREMGIHTIAAGAQDFFAWTELAGGDPELALPGLVTIDADLSMAGDRAFRSTVQATLAQVYERLGDLDMARAAAALADELTAPRDLLAVALGSMAHARLALREANWASCDQWSKDALDVALRTEMPFLQGTARLERARVAVALGRPHDARAEALLALETFRDSGDSPRVSWAVALLDEIEASSAVDLDERAGTGKGLTQSR